MFLTGCYETAVTCICCGGQKSEDVICRPGYCAACQQIIQDHGRDLQEQKALYGL